VPFQLFFISLEKWFSDIQKHCTKVQKYYTLWESWTQCLTAFQWLDPNDQSNPKS
jgi:hypothetical protein